MKCKLSNTLNNVSALENDFYLFLYNFAGCKWKNFDLQKSLNNCMLFDLTSSGEKRLDYGR